jgi:Ca2+-binding EF-hand superfamily protein
LKSLDNFSDWEKIIKDCDQNGDGVIDFEEFISAAMDRKILGQS